MVKRKFEEDEEDEVKIFLDDVEHLNKYRLPIHLVPHDPACHADTSNFWAQAANFISSQPVFHYSGEQRENPHEL